MRRFGALAGLFLAVTAASSAGSLAMDEQRGPAPAAVSPDAPKADVQEATEPAKSNAGTEIRIPGLGKIGTLPKMDFGLELLYGAAETKPTQDVEPLNGDDQRDLTIHGSVKHRF